MLFVLFLRGLDLRSYVDWLAAANISSTSSGEERPQEQITLDLFQNCDVPEEVSRTFDSKVDLNDDAVGRSCYTRGLLCS